MTTINEGEDCDITVFQNAAFIEVFYSRDEDEVTVIPFPAGTTGRSQGRTSGKLQVTFTVTVDEVAGTVTLSATPEQTDAITEGGRYDIFLDYPGIDLPTMFVRGKMIFKTKVTT